MPSLAHEIAIARLGANPSLLPLLAQTLLGKTLPRRRRRIAPLDSTVRIADPDAVRPDLVLGHGKRGPWDAVEVQRAIDPDKERRWAVLVSLLFSQRGCMGDLWVLTARERVARWARRACLVAGPGGSELRVVPVVLLLTQAQLDVLLDERHPELAFFAAWAMQGRRDGVAEQAALRALEITRKLPKSLRRKQNRDIFNVLGEQLRATLRKKIMDTTSHLETPEYREMRLTLEAIGKVDGKRDALIAVLKARGLIQRTSALIREQVRSCSDPGLLDRWIARASTANSLAEALAPAAQRAGVRRAAKPVRATPRSGARKALARPR